MANKLDPSDRDERARLTIRDSARRAIRREPRVGRQAAIIRAAAVSADNMHVQWSMYVLYLEYVCTS